MSFVKNIPVRPHMPAASGVVRSGGWVAHFTSGTLPDELSLLRASSGSRLGPDGVLSPVATNTPRLDTHPVSLAQQGLLLETQRTNLLRQSGDAGHATWVKFQCAVAGTGAAKAPDGSTDVLPLVVGTAASIHLPNQSVSIIAGSTVTFSVYLKKGTYDKVMVALESNDTANGCYVNVDLTTGNAGASGNRGTGTYGGSTVEPMGNGWHRVTLTGTVAPAATSARCSVLFVNPMLGTATLATGISFTGNGTDSFYMWGMQAEVAMAASGYIASTSAAATRAPDVATLPAAAMALNPLEGTFVVEGMFAALTGTTQRIFEVYTNNGNRLLASINAAGQFTVGGVTAGVGDVSMTSALGPVTALPHTVFKIAVAYRLNDWACCVNSGTVATDTAANVPPMTTINLGCAYNSVTQMDGWIRRVAYYPLRLPNGQLQALTR